jgi:hypothetical protein
MWYVTLLSLLNVKLHLVQTNKFLFFMICDGNWFKLELFLGSDEDETEEVISFNAGVSTDDESLSFCISAACRDKSSRAAFLSMSFVLSLGGLPRGFLPGAFTNFIILFE